MMSTIRKKRKQPAKKMVLINSETFECLRVQNFLLDVFTEKQLFSFVPLLCILFKFHLCGISKPLVFHSHKSLSNRILNLQLLSAHLIVKLAELNFINSYY